MAAPQNPNVYIEFEYPMPIPDNPIHTGVRVGPVMGFWSELFVTKEVRFHEVETEGPGSREGELYRETIYTKWWFTSYCDPDNPGEYPHAEPGTFPRWHRFPQDKEIYFDRIGHLWW